MESEAEKAATSWANNRCPEQGPEFIVWTMCRGDFLAGVAWERERIRSTAPSYVTIPGTNEARLCYVIQVSELDKEKF